MNAQEALKELDKLIKKSELVKACQKASPAIKEQAAKLKAKPLTPEQIAALEQNDVHAKNWKKIYAPAGLDTARIRESQLIGEVVLPVCDADISVGNGIELPTGIYNSTLSNCVLEKNVLVKDTSLVHAYRLEEGAAIVNCGRLAYDGASAFGNGQELLIAIETGGRETLTFAELTVPVAEALCRERADKAFQTDYVKKVSAYLKSLKCKLATVAQAARLLDSGNLINSYFGPGCRVENATSIINSTLLSSSEEPAEVSHGAMVRDSIVQWGAEASSMAIVDVSVLTEHSHVERHGKVTHTIVGPNTGVAEGEVTSCLLGPFVGFHHQALLIAAFWPEGRGNMAYGANVGSNHTSKAPDQEIWPGEGNFYGLGANIKFPTDLSRSPYTIIASGVSSLPQKVEFPFSLINTPGAIYPGISPAFNEIMPGWVLSDNIFTIKRNEKKYISRNKAKRSVFDLRVFRPEIVDLMIDARNRLEVRKLRNIYTSREISGLGKNYMLDNARRKGITAYTFYVQLYALRTLYNKIVELPVSKRKTAMSSLLTKTGKGDWEHARTILLREFGQIDASEAMDKLVEMDEKVAQSVQISKEKDDQRGVKIIPDYGIVHPAAANDSFVKETWKELEELKKVVKSLPKGKKK